MHGTEDIFKRFWSYARESNRATNSVSNMNKKPKNQCQVFRCPLKVNAFERFVDGILAEPFLNWINRGNYLCPLAAINFKYKNSRYIVRYMHAFYPNTIHNKILTCCATRSIPSLFWIELFQSLLCRKVGCEASIHFFLSCTNDISGTKWIW